jgi:hypothetical protein
VATRLSASDHRGLTVQQTSHRSLDSLVCSLSEAI